MDYGLKGIDTSRTVTQKLFVKMAYTMCWRQWGTSLPSTMCSDKGGSLKVAMVATFTHGN